MTASPATLRAGSPYPKWPVFLGHAHGWFYIVSGLWPVISPGTFQAVTGPKLDYWLAQTVGLLLTLTGVVIELATRARRLTREILVLAIGTPALLAGIDVYCVFQPRTKPTYLLDCVGELGIVAAWVVAACQLRRLRSGDPR